MCGEVRHKFFFFNVSWPLPRNAEGCLAVGHGPAGPGVGLWALLGAADTKTQILLLKGGEDAPFVLRVIGHRQSLSSQG